MQSTSFTDELVHLLQEYLHSGRYADKILAYFFANNQYKGQEKAEIAQCFYDIIRNFRLLNAVIGKNEISGLSKDDLLFIIHVWEVKNENIVDPEVSSKLISCSSQRKLKYSIPDWIDAYAVKLFGASKWENIIAALNEAPKTYIRSNSLKIELRDLQDELASEGIHTSEVKGVQHGLLVGKNANLFHTLCFQEGMFEVQDISSQMVSEFMELKPGMRVADTCAGAGGKSLHIAAITQNKGRIIAFDTVEWKLKELQNRASRADVTNIETRHISTTKVIKRLHESFDRVLLDVPCTGTGIWRRNPDSKWRLTEEDLNRMLGIQAEILQKHSLITKIGGKLVYSTCSIFPSEGEEQVQNFLKNNEGKWQLEAQKRIEPDTDGYDGFYMARLVRVG